MTAEATTASAPGGLVEALLALHQPGKTWGGGNIDNCKQCHGRNWPCPTVLAICEATGSPVPEQRVSACSGAIPSEDGDGYLHCKLDNGHHLDGSRCAASDGREAPWDFKTMEEALWG